MSRVRLRKWMPVAGVLTAGAIALGSAAAFAASGSTAGDSSAPAPVTGELVKIAGYLNLTPATLLADLRAGQSLEQIASAQNVATATLTAGIEADMKARMNSLVASGKWTQAQATARETQFDAHLPKLLSQPGPFLRGWTHGGRRMGPGFGPGFGLMAETANLLHLTPQQLMTDLRGGQTVAQIAQAQNVSAQTLTQELESWAQEQVNTRIGNFVNGKLPAGGPPGGGSGGSWGGPPGGGSGGSWGGPPGGGSGA